MRMTGLIFAKIAKFFVAKICQLKRISYVPTWHGSIDE
jgi:hypothetical protein